MAKKIKKFSSDIAVPRRNSEKFRRAGRLFDRAIIAYVLLVILSAIAGSHGHYELQHAADNGFAVCFLLLPAILPLMLAGGIGALFGYPGHIVPGQEIWLLGICDLILAVNVWWIIRLISWHKQSTSMLRTAKNFTLIIVVWGAFQLGCTVMHMAWEHCGFSALYQTQKENPKPDRP